MLLRLTDDEHEVLLSAISELIDCDPEPNSLAGTILGLLAIVVEDYEVQRYPMGEEP
jgi:antitoxin component HigA of HigAB toxin-antitoxin module